MHSRLMGVALGLLLVFSGCGGDDGDDEITDPIRCGGLHWSDAAGQDVYTGCEGESENWTCACAADPSEAFQGDTASDDSAATCAQAVAGACEMLLPEVSACAGLADDIGTCWNVTDASGGVSSSSFACRCEEATAPSEVSASSCQGALYDTCDTRTDCSADGDTCSPGNDEDKWICECAAAGGATDVVYADTCDDARTQSCN